MSAFKFQLQFKVNLELLEKTRYILEEIHKNNQCENNFKIDSWHVFFFIRYLAL